MNKFVKSLILPFVYNIIYHYIPLLPSRQCRRAECQTQSLSVSESQCTSTAENNKITIIIISNSSIQSLDEKHSLSFSDRDKRY